jgi:threonyl-tRNA synthetase
LSSSVKVVLPDNSELELPAGATGLDAARAIGPKLAEQAVLVKANGEQRDLRLPLPDGAHIQILTSRDAGDPDALYVLRHSSAHLLAEAVRRLYPGVKIAIGPPIENGFYYDFEFPEPVHESELERIEEEVKKEIAEGREWTREEVSRQEARERFLAEDEPYKVELVDTAEGDISLYTQFSKSGGEFTDLCRGPHLQNAQPIKAFKLTGLAGAYWRGDEKNTQLTRIYGTAFYSQADLDAYLERLEQARARDHRRLGVQLDLFHLSDHSPGSPFWHPKGMIVWNQLEDLRRRENARRGYLEVKTPLIYDEQTYETSGHLQNYEENIFWVQSHSEHERRLALKPMNCPGHMLLFGSRLRSYKELPMRFAEASTLHRDEKGGTLHGLLRVKHITQDDSHIFVTPDQIEEEIFGCLDYASYLYDLFEMEARFELSTRPDKKLGTDEEWDFTEGALRAALDRRRIEYEVNEGDGAFYGPKIDLHMLDAIGRSWQMGTIQLDSQMPQRFGLRYMGADNEEHFPYVIHRALLGSLERFVGILTEHYAGAFPFWLAPVQIRVIPVGESHRPAAAALAERLAPYRVEVDDSDETVGKRIRNAEVEKLPFVVVYGDKESDESLAVREHGGEQSTLALAEFQDRLATLSVWQAGAEPSLTSWREASGVQPSEVD